MILTWAEKITAGIVHNIRGHIIVLIAKSINEARKRLFTA